MPLFVVVRASHLITLYIYAMVLIMGTKVLLMIPAEEDICYIHLSYQRDIIKYLFFIGVDYMKIVGFLLLLILLGVVFLFCICSIIISIEICREENELYEEKRETTGKIHN